MTAAECTFIEFSVPGEPQGKGRARMGRGRMFTPAKTVAYEGLIALAATGAMKGRPPTDHACEVLADAVCAIPKGWSKAKREMAMNRVIRPTKKPDADNIAKAIGDGCNGVLWRDDCQIVDIRVRKVYGDTPRLSVSVMIVVEGA